MKHAQFFGSRVSMAIAAVLSACPTLAAQVGSPGFRSDLQVVSPSLSKPPDVLDFEDLEPGTIVSTMYGSGGSGPVQVHASNPLLGAVNAAVVFDSAHPSAIDLDLGTPSVDFGGPGVGEGGAKGSTYENATPKGHILVVGENLIDLDGDGLVDVPGNAGGSDTVITVDFSAIGPVRVDGLILIDTDEDQAQATVQFFDENGLFLGLQLLPVTGDNGVAAVDVGGISGVSSLEILLLGSGAVDEIRFQEECSGQIGDSVWLDLDQDGIQEAGEPGIQGATVRLFDTSGALQAKTKSGVRGRYEFTGLCAGAYLVEIDPSSVSPRFVLGPCNVGGRGILDGNCSPALVVLADDEDSDKTIDFGFITPCEASIGDRVWHDVNRDGIQDPSEPGLEGVRIVLYDLAGSELGETTSDPRGDYLFMGLCAGAYLVEIDPTTVPLGFTPTDCEVGGGEGLDSNCGPATVILQTNGSSDLTVDFGFQSECIGTIGEFVWHDLDADGIQEPDEPGLEGIRVLLLDDAGMLAASVTSGPGGFYAFTGLCAGSYTVAVDAKTIPPDFLPTGCEVGIDTSIDSECSPATVVLDDDFEQEDSVDLGFFTLAKGNLGNLVWADLDCDGLQDLFVALTGSTGSELGIEGAELILRDDMGVILRTTTSDAEGSYVFTGLEEGTYMLEVDPTTLPEGFASSACTIGPDQTIDSDCSPTTVDLTLTPLLGGITGVDPIVVDFSVDFAYKTTICGGVGCGSGYWKNHPELWPTGITPQTLFADVFEDAFPGLTLMDVLNLQGGQLDALGRQVVAALLNAASDDVAYALSVVEVPAIFNDAFPATVPEYVALKNYFQDLNAVLCTVP